MAGVVRLPPRAVTPPPRMTQPLASGVNRARIVQVAARLSEHFQSTAPLEPNEFFQLCFALARGIDYAVSHGDVPPNTTDLPPVIKQAYHRRGEALLQPAVMVLLVSVKNACRNGWFLPSESDELLAMAHEISNTFCWAKNMTPEEKHTLQLVSNVTSRFYPHMKLSRLFASFEVKSGYEILVADIYIPRNITREERIYLFIAETDIMETSNCIISPPHVNFIINGRGVDRRTNVSMELGPQFPSDITKLLKYGMNLFQAVGSFHGNYIIAIAVMTLTNMPGAIVLQDHVKPIVPLVESDSEIIEGASRISLNCPISFKRIKTPVKGHLCKHYQCFDFKNFLEMNSRKPSWRCPHCNQSVSYVDIRLDRFMEKILKEAGEISDIVISANGTWEAFGEHLVNPPLMHNRALPDISDGIPAGETTEFSINASDVVDLTVEDYIGAEGNLESSNEIIIQVGSTSEIEEKKPLQGKLIDIPTLSRTVLRSTNGVAHDGSQVSKEMPSEAADMTSGTCDQTSNSQAIAILESYTSNNSLAPGLDVVPPSPNHGSSSSHDMLLAIPTSTALEAQLNPSRFGNSISSTRTERLPIPRLVSRVPVAIQALPAHLQHQTSQKKARTSENDSNPISCASPISEFRGLRFPDLASQSGFTTQIISLPALSQGDSTVRLDRPRVSDAHRSFLRQSSQSAVQVSTSLHQASQSPLDAFSETRRKAQDHLLAARGESQAGSPRGIPVTQASRVSPPIGEQEQFNPSPALALRRSEIFAEPMSEQNWRPTGRMRGALSGSEYSAALRHYLEQPSLSPTTPTNALSNPLSTRSSSNATGTAPINHQKIGASGYPASPP